MTDLFDLKAVNAYAADPAKQPDYIEAYENIYDEKLRDVAKTVAEQKKKIILLTGPSSSGKTTTAFKLQLHLSEFGLKSVTISLDNFFKNKEDVPVDKNGNFEFEKVEALEIDLVKEKLCQLAEGEKTKLPVFDFHTGHRTDDAKEVELSDGVAVIEGIHAHNDLLLGDLSHDSFLKLYISVHSGFEMDGKIILPKRDVRFCRRLLRDYNYRSSSAVHTCGLWVKVVEDEIRYVLPNSDTADVRIDTTFPYEIGLYRDRLVDILNEVPEDSIWIKRANYFKSALSHFEVFDRQFIPKTSLLTEFSGGGSFKYK